jgi:hypothetical protein
MADGVAVTPGVGATVATDELSNGQHAQYVKLLYGADGSATAATLDANGLLVNLGVNNDVVVSGTVAVSGGTIDVVGITVTDVTVSNVVTVAGDVGTIDQFDLTNSNPAAVAIVDANGDQITSFGGGTQYTEGDTDASITGTAMLMENGNTLVPAQGNSSDGLLVNLGSNNDVSVTGTVSAAQSGAWTVTANAGTNLNTSTLALESGGNLAAAVTALQIIDNAISGNEMQVDVLTMPTVTIGGTVTVDSELPAAATLADNTTNPTVTSVGTFGHVYDGSTWDRMPGTSADGVLVNLGANNDISGTVTANAGTNLNTSALALETGGNLAAAATSLAILDDWDNGASDGASVSGDVAHDTADAGEPVKIGAKAVAHGTNPTAVDANDRTNIYANRAGVLFVMGGHPNIVTLRANYTAAETNTAIVTVAGGLKIVVTRLSVTADKANTVDVQCRIGFATATTPTTTGVLLSHPGIAAGSGVVEGNGSGMLGVGADGEDLRITCEAPTSGSIDVVVSYFTIES